MTMVRVTPQTFWLEIFSIKTCTVHNEIKRAILTMDYDIKNIKYIIIHHFGKRLLHLCILTNLIRLKIYHRINWQKVCKGAFARAWKKLLYIIVSFWKQSKCSFYLVRHGVGICAVFRIQMNEYARGVVSQFNIYLIIKEHFKEIWISAASLD